MSTNRTITMSAKVSTKAPAAGWRDTPHDAWRVTLQFQGRQATFAYHTGTGHRVDGYPIAPPIGYVLSSLASEASAAELCTSVEDYADEYGYSLDEPDERRIASGSYLALTRQAESLRTLLGEDYYDVLIYQAPNGGDWSEFKGNALAFPDAEIPDDFPVRELDDDEHPAGKVTCGSCGRSWDDSIATEWTPAPAARCPFEGFHAEGETA